MITTADAAEILTLVAACHHRTAPRLDDPQAAVALATVWAELLNVYRLDKPDITAAIKKRALSHPEAPEPAEIIAFAREIRRDRAERETDTERDARQNFNQRRIQAMVAELAETKTIGHETPEATDRRCGCGRPIFDDAVTCQECYRAVRYGPHQSPNGNKGSTA